MQDTDQRRALAIIILALNSDKLTALLGHQEIFHFPCFGAILQHEQHTVASHNIPAQWHTHTSTVDHGVLWFIMIKCTAQCCLWSIGGKGEQHQINFCSTIFYYPKSDLGVFWHLSLWTIRWDKASAFWFIGLREIFCHSRAGGGKKKKIKFSDHVTGEKKYNMGKSGQFEQVFNYFGLAGVYLVCSSPKCRKLNSLPLLLKGCLLHHYNHSNFRCFLEVCKINIWLFEWKQLLHLW